MKYYVWLIMCLAFPFEAIGQENFRAVSLNEIMVTIVPQNDCPLKIVDAIAVELSDKKGDLLYSVTNSGEKVIRSYTIVKWYSDNTGEVTTGVMPVGALLDVHGVAGNLVKGKINSATKRPQRDDMKVIAFVMIGKISFTDGSQFDGTVHFHALKKHLARIADRY